MLPVLNSTKQTKDKLNVVTQFAGLNLGLNIADGEFCDMVNMTNDYFPVFANRKKRGIIDTLDNPLGVCGGDKLCYVDDNKLYYNSNLVLSLEETNVERQLIMMGALLCVFPDGVIYNTIKGTSENVENTRTVTSLTMSMVKLDGTAYDIYTGDEAPEDTSKLWLDTSSDPVVLKMYSDNYSMWTSVGTTYVKLAATDIGKGFKDYDSVKVSGIPIKGYNDYDFNDTLIVYKASDDYLIVAGLIDQEYVLPETGHTLSVTVKRELPKMDFVCELNNRIFGCRYGLNNAGETVNEVYACKLGDPTNWNSFAGLASDSYAATCGSEGEFTGIASYQGYMFFFKEDGFHKLYGTQPSDFTMVFRPCRGVALGSHKSIAVVNQVLFYKSRDAIIAYDGSENIISNKLGVEPYYDAVAVGYRNKYYVSMRDAQYNYKMYVYDITKGTWTIEDNLIAKYMVYADNATYIIDSDNNLLCINNEAIYTLYFPHQIIDEANIIEVEGIEYDYKHNFPQEDLYPGPMISGTLEDTFEWQFTTGDLTFGNPYQKYVKNIVLRMSQDVGSKVKIEVEYDSSGDWEYVTEKYAEKKKSYQIPIVVRRADHLRLRLSGWGEFRLYSLTRVVEGGSGDDET